MTEHGRSDSRALPSDLLTLRDVLGKQIADGFRETNSSIHELTSRVTHGEIAVGRLDIRVKNVEREVFHRRRDDDDDPSEEEQRAITRRDVKVGVVVFGAALGIFKALPWLVALSQVRQ